MKSFTATSTFPFPFNHTSEGLWHKYPNEYTPHVVSVDTLERSLDQRSGILRSERIIGVKQPVPRWVVKLVGVPEETYVREVTWVVPGKNGKQPPKVLMASVNLSMSNILKVTERISYTPTKDGESTLFRQLADIKAAGKFNLDGCLWRIGERIEGWSLDRFASNAHTGREGLNSVLEALLESAKAEAPRIS